MKQLIVIDIAYPVEVHIYNVSKDIDINEKYIESLGFDVDYCQWAYGDNVSIMFHKEVLK